MNRATWWFCRAVLLLNRIPRYGRLYRLENIPANAEETYPDWKRDAAEWTWQRHGHWGINMLDRMGLMWRWLDEAERRHNATSGSVQRRTDDGD